MNGNAAYDLSRFEEKQKRPAMEVIPPKKSPRKWYRAGHEPCKGNYDADCDGRTGFRTDL